MKTYQIRSLDSYHFPLSECIQLAAGRTSLALDWLFKIRQMKNCKIRSGVGYKCPLSECIQLEAGQTSRALERLLRNPPDENLPIKFEAWLVTSVLYQNTYNLELHEHL